MTHYCVSYKHTQPASPKLEKRVGDRCGSRQIALFRYIYFENIFTFYFTDQFSSIFLLFFFYILWFFLFPFFLYCFFFCIFYCCFFIFYCFYIFLNCLLQMHGDAKVFPASCGAVWGWCGAAGGAGPPLHRPPQRQDRPQVSTVLYKV